MTVALFAPPTLGESLSTPQVITSPLKLSSSALHNNSALASLRHFSVRPLASSMGAEVLGLNLSVPLGDAQLKEVKSALHRHGMLIFRDQRLTHAAHRNASPLVLASSQKTPTPAAFRGTRT